MLKAATQAKCRNLMKPFVSLAGTAATAPAAGEWARTRLATQGRLLFALLRRGKDARLDSQAQVRKDGVRNCGARSKKDA
jgi:hypothetical protein